MPDGCRIVNTFALKHPGCSAIGKTQPAAVPATTVALLPVPSNKACINFSYSDIKFSSVFSNGGATDTFLSLAIKDRKNAFPNIKFKNHRFNSSEQILKPIF